MKKENNYNILNEEEFKSYVVEKMDSVAKALHEISHGMVKFKTEYFDAINKNIKTISEEEDKLKWRMERLELAHKMFRAQVFGGITAVIGILEIARQMFGD